MIPFIVMFMPGVISEMKKPSKYVSQGWCISSSLAAKTSKYSKVRGERAASVCVVEAGADMNTEC